MATTTTKPVNPGVAESLPPIQEESTANLPAPRSRSNGVQAIVPNSWQEITAIAGAICRAKMAPKSYCNDAGEPFPDKVAVAIMHGMEVGMTPMASLQSIAVINGMPGLYGDGLLAVVRASGLLEDIQETLEWDAQLPLKATCRVKRKGETTWGVTEVYRADCAKAGWLDKKGPWTLTPHRMMQMRARGWALRDKFADVLRGLRSAEEMEDMVDVTPKGSATVGPTPPEPMRETAKAAQAAGNSSQEAGKAAVADNDKSTSAAATPHSEPAKAGQAGPKESAAGGAQPGNVATGQPEPDKKPIAARTGKRKAKDKPVTDVKDQNDVQSAKEHEADTGHNSPGPDPEAKPVVPAEPPVFEKYNRPGDFFIFSDAFLEDPKRTVTELEQWHAFYSDYVQKLKEQGSPATKNWADECLMLYGSVMAKLLPPQE